MKTLNLPEIECKIREKEENYEIFDVIRKKFVFLTPEEWVRQHFIHYMIHYLGYPKPLLTVESGLNYNSLHKRSDIVAYNSEGAPILLVECKSYKVKVNQQALNQVAIYNKRISATHVVLTNGVKHYCFKKEGSSYNTLNEIPDYVCIA
ncbi:MAG: type I restriction enzyme HsdR N-terminal domain-containing protein [Bacteroidota bacterium]